MFIGSLFKLELLRENILHQCIQGLFGDVDNPDVESIEALCKLLTSVGSTMDTKARLEHVIFQIQQTETILYHH